MAARAGAGKSSQKSPEADGRIQGIAQDFASKSLHPFCWESSLPVRAIGSDSESTERRRNG